MFIFIYLVALLIQGQSQHVDQDKEHVVAYTFGDSLIINEKLNMMSYGPYRSGLKGCTSRRAMCINSSIMALVAPYKCRDLIANRTIPIIGGNMLVFGKIMYTLPGEKYPEATWLISTSTHKKTILGYREKRGIIFVAFLSDHLYPLLAKIIKTTNQVRRSRAFLPLTSQILPVTSGYPVFPCHYK